MEQKAKHTIQTNIWRKDIEEKSEWLGVGVLPVSWLGHAAIEMDQRPAVLTGKAPSSTCRETTADAAVGRPANCPRGSDHICFFLLPSILGRSSIAVMAGADTYMVG